MQSEIFERHVFGVPERGGWRRKLINSLGAEFQHHSAFTAVSRLKCISRVFASVRLTRDSHQKMRAYVCVRACVYVCERVRYISI